jgi:tetratricopeptide (TPR) repeat protein
MAAWCYAWRKINGWMTDRVKEIAETERLARQAAEFGPEDAVALSRSAHALAFVVGDLDAAASFVDRALVLNPNVAGAWYASGWIRVWLGEPDLAIAHMATGMRLSPRDPHMIGMQGGTAFAHFIAGRYEEAAAWAEKAMWEQSNYLTTLLVAAASNALAGRLADARKSMMRVRELDPAMRVSKVGEWATFRRPDDLTRLKEGLRGAGLPERVGKSGSGRLCCKSLKTPGDNILVAANGALVYAKYGWRAPAQVYRKWDFGRKR